MPTAAENKFNWFHRKLVDKLPGARIHRFKNFLAERAPMKHDLENLIQGTPTKDKWFKLQEIAEKYEILAE